MLPALLSKDPTLTGRTQLWDLVLIAISRHAWLGYGFDSFWQGLQGDSLTIIRGVGWLVPTAHNGYLDLLLGMGYIGVLLFIPASLQTLVRAVRYITGESHHVTLSHVFPLALLIFWLVYNLNESALITRSGLPFLLVIAVSASLKLHRSIVWHSDASASAEYCYGLPSYLDDQFIS